VREDPASYEYENEDQSLFGLRPGMRVRHEQFGVGNVIAVEEYNDDQKITVRFNSVGTKKLIGKFARLQPA
jgi:DNA helicase-2/ATP-dependent DNA helicase PcrA